MSKKQGRSDRNVDLPDWADEVTPSDEVMKKFYAPTGTFKSGPIIVPQPTAGDRDELKGAEQSAHAEAPPQTSPANKSDELPPRADRKIDQSATSIGREASSAGRPFQQPKSPAAVQGLNNDEQKIGDESRRGEASSTERLIKPHLPTPPQASESKVNRSFGDFEKEWGTFLTEGQLRVIKELFKLTFEKGSGECLTSTAKLAEACGFKKRWCAIIVKQLENKGFVERPLTWNTSQLKGTVFRLHFSPLRPEERVERVYYLEDGPEISPG